MTNIEEQILKNQVILMQEVNLLMQLIPDSAYKRNLLDTMLRRFNKTKEVLKDD